MRALPSPGEALGRIQRGDRRMLARALTCVEGTTPEQREWSRQLLEQVPALSKATYRIALSGAPGVGKSSLIEALGCEALERSYRVAVLAVDPSSQLSGGSLLGDKTRMPKLGSDQRAFVRPSPSRRQLGGVTDHLADSLQLCELAGYDLLVVETVGVGQSELDAAALVDEFLLVIAPSAGDEVQGLKRGITEVADRVVVNKFDIDPGGASATQLAYRSALSLVHALVHTEPPEVHLVSASSGYGVAELFAAICQPARIGAGDPSLLSDRLKRRSERGGELLSQLAVRAMVQHLIESPAVGARLSQLSAGVRSGELSLRSALAALIADLPQLVGE